jgi:hypothetical protein
MSIVRHFNALVGLALLAIPVATFAQNCTLLVPNNPLSATGLATPYVLSSTDTVSVCSVANPNSGVFVQGAYISPSTGAIHIYNPLVVDAANPTPALPLIPPTLPADAVVAIFVGSDTVNTAFKFTNPHDESAANCLDGFGQEAWCNAPAFYAAAHAALDAGKLTAPPLGTGLKETNALPCPTVRSFRIVDQDQSDNVTTKYLSLANGTYASDTAANRTKLTNEKIPFSIIANPSDNLLNSEFVDPAIGCTPWMAPDAQDNNAMTPSMPTDELLANHFQAAPLALVPLSDPMTFNQPFTNVNPTTLTQIDTSNAESLFRMNLYRLNVEQPVSPDGADGNPTTYCANLRQIQLTDMLIKDGALLELAPSPVASLGTNLFAFFANRYSQSYQFLNCQQLLDLPSNITIIFNAEGVPIDAKITAP